MYYCNTIGYCFYISIYVLEQNQREPRERVNEEALEQAKYLMTQLVACITTA